MTSNEYFKEFSKEISRLDADDYATALEYFQDYADDAGLTTGEQLVAQFGTPKQLAIKVLADHAVNDESKQTKGPVDTKAKVRKNNNQIWLIILAIFSAPVAIPLAIGLVAALIGMIIAIIAIFGSIIFTILAVYVSIVIAGPVALYAGLGLITTSWPVAIVYLGGGLLALGAAFMLLPVLKWLAVGISHIIAGMFRWFYRHTIGRRSMEAR